MSRFTLKDCGLPFKKIVSGRQWVGRVGTHADGSYWGKIGKTMVSASTEVAAFELVVARHLGFPSADALKQQNREVRSERRARRRRVEAMATRMMAGDFSVLDQLMDWEPRR